jgi:hypothetical protein
MHACTRLFPLCIHRCVYTTLLLCKTKQKKKPDRAKMKHRFLLALLFLVEKYLTSSYNIPKNLLWA